MSEGGSLQVGELYVLMRADITTVEQGLEKVKSRTKQAGDQAERSFGSRTQRAYNQTGKATNDLAAKSERLRVIYNRIITSKEKLNDVDIRRAQRLSAEKQRIDELIRSNQRLTAAQAGGAGAGGAVKTGGTMATVGRYAGGFVGVTTAVTALGAGMRFVISTGAELESSLSDLSAITGIVGDDLDKLKQEAIDTGKELGTGAAAGVEAFKLLASNIDVSTIGGVEGLKKLGKEVQILSKASGVDLATAANVVASTLNQFSLGADQSARVVNALAAGAKYGAAEVEDLGQSIKEAGTSAAIAGISLETTIGALEILSQNAIKGSEAGTGLRNTMTILQSSADKLAKWGIEGVNLRSDGLVKTLQKLSPILSNTAAMADIFGRENLSVASILVKNAAAIDDMTAKVTGTNVAMEQASIQMDNLAGDASKLRANIQGIASSIYDDLNPSLRAATQLLNTLLTAMQDSDNTSRQWGVNLGTMLIRGMNMAGIPAVAYDANLYRTTGQVAPVGYKPSGATSGNPNAGKSYGQQPDPDALARAKALAEALEQQARAEEDLRKSRSATIKSIQDSMQAAFSAAEERTKLYGNEIGEVEEKLKAAGIAMNRLLDTGYVSAHSAEISKLKTQIEGLASVMAGVRGGSSAGNQIGQVATGLSSSTQISGAPQASAKDMIAFYAEKMPEAINATAAAQQMLSKITQDYFDNVMASGVDMAITGTSQLIGNLLTGVDKMSNAFTMFGDMMKQIMADVISQMIRVFILKQLIGFAGGPTTKAGMFFGGVLTGGAKMASGGVVPPGYPNDTYQALLTSGETVVPKRLSESPMMQGGRSSGRGRIQIEGRISGNDLALVLSRHQRKMYTHNGGQRF